MLVEKMAADGLLTMEFVLLHPLEMITILVT